MSKPTAGEAGGGLELDLSTPDAHKTAAAFGPVVTAVPKPAAALLTAWLALTERDTPAALAQQPYVWVLADDAAKPVAPSTWTSMVKAAFKRHAGVPLAPKELRSSLVCWLRSEANTDAVLKSAAWAMRRNVASSTYRAASSDAKGVGQPTRSADAVGAGDAEEVAGAAPQHRQGTSAM